MQAIAFYFAYPIIWIIARFPFSVIYKISDVVYFILFYVVKYRRETIISNLKIAFPAKTDQEILTLCKKSTRHFCDVFIEMVKSTTITDSQLKQRFICKDASEINAFAKANQPVVLMMGHQASYEWTIALDDVLKFKNYAVYKPLKNTYFDQFIRSIRSKFGTSLVPMKKAYAILKESQQSTEEIGLFALVADQAPKPSAAQYFTLFFNQPTAVFMGGERMACQYEMPVFFLNVRKEKRGHYSASFKKITNDASKEADWFVTDQFYKNLEQQIECQPQYYLWSHKRWKTSPANARRVVELSPRVHQ